MEGDKRWEYQYFPTPRALARLMVERAALGPGDMVLEPSAGQGGLLDEIERWPVAGVHACELMPENREVLRARGVELVGRDFLEFRVYATYSRIVANPPFTRDQDIAHVRHMYEILRYGGRVVAVMSARCLGSGLEEHRAFVRWVKERGRYERLGGGAFAELGVSVETMLVELEK